MIKETLTFLLVIFSAVHVAYSRAVIYNFHHKQPYLMLKRFVVQNKSSTHYAVVASASKGTSRDWILRWHQYLAKFTSRHPSGRGICNEYEYLFKHFIAHHLFNSLTVTFRWQIQVLLIRNNQVRVQLERSLFFSTRTKMKNLNRVGIGDKSVLSISTEVNQSEQIKSRQGTRCDKISPKTNYREKCSFFDVTCYEAHSKYVYPRVHVHVTSCFSTCVSRDAMTTPRFTYLTLHLGRFKNWIFIFCLN